MSIHSYKNYFTRLDYRIDNDRRKLIVDMKINDRQDRSFFILYEFSPVYDYSKIRRREFLTANIFLSILSVVMFAGAVIAFIGKNTEWLFALWPLVIFSIAFAVYFFVMYRKSRYLCVAFQSLFREDSHLLVCFPYDTDLSQSLFLSELQMAIAESFIVRKPELNNPVISNKMAEDFQQLHKDGIISEEELSTLNRKILGISPLQRNIGFFCNE